MLMAINGSAHAIDASEQTLTTAFLYNFAKYTEWPQHIAASSNAFLLCYPAGSEIAPFMSRLASRSLRDKPIAVREIKEAKDFSGCHLVYFERESPLFTATDVPSLQALVVGRNVPEADISLFRKGETLQFKIRQQRALDHGIKFRSQLLKIAAETE